MKIKKPPPKCAECGDWMILARCRNVITDGCDRYFCWLCWPAHRDEELGRDSSGSNRAD